jgi:NADPH:quinone reductase-like Zn-dependent oxidoreductase
MEHRFPIVLGRDFAGMIDQVGEGVTTFATGDDVFGVVLTQPLHAGGFAEYVLVPVDHHIVRIPAGLDHATAGVLGLAGSAAVALLDAVAPVAEDTVLVIGATGGVGAVAIQLLAEKGAVVIATANGDGQAAHVRGLGAHHVVDYGQDLAGQVREVAANGVAVVLHLAGDPMAAADLVADGGRFATLLGIGPEAFAGRAFAAYSAVASPLPSVLGNLSDDVVAGRLRIPVQRTYRLDEVPGAFSDFAAGTLGKLAVTVD